jgi:hypothetical protein
MRRGKEPPHKKTYSIEFLTDDPFYLTGWYLKVTTPHSSQYHGPFKNQHHVTRLLKWLNQRQSQNEVKENATT